MKTFKLILQFVGLATLATIAHEAYHWFTVDQPIEICMDSKGVLTRYIGGDTSEIIAYTITFVIMFVGSFLIFREYRRKK